MTRRYRILLAGTCSALASPASAHSPIEGLGSFYNGVLHPVFVPAHLLLLIAVGLFLGQQARNHHYAAIMVFAAATFAGLITAWFVADVGLQPWILAGATAVGLLAAARLTISIHWPLLIAGLAGLALGMDSSYDMLSGREKVAALFGSGVGLYLLLLYPLLLADRFSEREWQRIGARIVGSWIAASSVLVLALTLSQQQ